MPRLLKLAFGAAVLTVLVMGLLIGAQYGDNAEADAAIHNFVEGLPGLFFTLAFLGIGPLILVLAGRYAKRRLTVVFWGLVAAGLMGLVAWVGLVAAGLGSATSGSQEGYRSLNWVVACYLISLVVYFVFAFTRLSATPPLAGKQFLIKRTDGEGFSLPESQFQEVLRPSSFPSRPVESAMGYCIEVGGCEVLFSYEWHGMEVRFKGESLTDAQAAQIVSEIAENITKATGQKHEVSML